MYNLFQEGRGVKVEKLSVFRKQLFLHHVVKKTSKQISVNDWALNLLFCIYICVLFFLLFLLSSPEKNTVKSNLPKYSVFVKLKIKDF